MSFKARFASPHGDDLRALLRKYDTLAKLRDERDLGGSVAPRGELRRLAREFPGALRELDTVSREEIERRRLAIAATLDGGPIEPWMSFIAAYHTAMRAALFIKARLSSVNPARAAESHEDSAPAVLSRAPASANEGAPRAVVPADVARRLAALASADAGVPIDESFVDAVAWPPSRRLNAAVFQRLGTELGVPPETMWETLFPSRRAGRF